MRALILTALLLGQVPGSGHNGIFEGFAGTMGTNLNLAGYDLIGDALLDPDTLIHRTGANEWTVAAGGVAILVCNATSCTSPATIQAEQLTSTDDADINDSLTCGDLVIDEAAGALSFTGATSATISTTTAKLNLSSATGQVGINGSITPVVLAAATDVAPTPMVITNQEPYAATPPATAPTNATGASIILQPSNGVRRIGSGAASGLCAADPCVFAAGQTITIPVQVSGTVTNCVLTANATEDASQRRFDCDGHTPAQCGASIVVAASTVSPCSLITTTYANKTVSFARTSTVSYLGPVASSAGGITAQNGSDGTIISNGMSAGSSASGGIRVFAAGSSATYVSIGADSNGAQIQSGSGSGVTYIRGSSLTVTDYSTGHADLVVNDSITSQSAALTAGTMTQTDGGRFRSVTGKYAWTNAMVVALGASLTGDITVATLPAKTEVVDAMVVIDTACTGATDTLTVSVGRTGADYIDYIVASNAKAAANTVYGDAALERGTNLTGFDVPSWTGTTNVVAHFVATDGGADNLDDVLTCTGHVVLTTRLLP